MRLWHELLIPYLPRLQLLGENRECCALRGKGWERKHSTVDYVFTYPMIYLYYYHLKVMDEMKNRKYKINNENWYALPYRGKKIGFVSLSDIPGNVICFNNEKDVKYPEHNDQYLRKCLNLIYDRITSEPWKYKDDEEQIKKFFKFHKKEMWLWLK